ncbi:MAG TPA: helix-turn-helix transcriptional regulator [Solirubrobacterales bacterium]|jgi:transcriptional regulator with XRE-family HTH domain|nr:helix-turn-helix transcriptional regulator [Solirubrobacterales bacterium]
MTFSDAAAARFASNVVRLREEAGFSQEVMADRSAVSTAMIGKVESGKALPYFDAVIRMAGALSTTPSALVEGITWKPGEIVESDPQDYTVAESQPKANA